MAALSFPASPVNGQVFSSNGKAWVYDSTTTSWLASAQPTPVAAFIDRRVCVGGETSVVFDNIPQTYTDLVFVFQGRDTASGSTDLGLFMGHNGDTTSGNYTG